MGKFLTFKLCTHAKLNCLKSTVYFLFCLIVCFVLRHNNFIDHLMPNQVKVNKSEKKFLQGKGLTYN